MRKDEFIKIRIVESTLEKLQQSAACSDRPLKLVDLTDQNKAEARK